MADEPTIYETCSAQYAADTQLSELLACISDSAQTEFTATTDGLTDGLNTFFLIYGVSVASATYYSLKAFTVLLTSLI